MGGELRGSAGVDLGVVEVGWWRFCAGRGVVGASGGCPGAAVAGSRRWPAPVSGRREGVDRVEGRLEDVGVWVAGGEA